MNGKHLQLSLDRFFFSLIFSLLAFFTVFSPTRSMALLVVMRARQFKIIIMMIHTHNFSVKFICHVTLIVSAHKTSRYFVFLFWIKQEKHHRNYFHLNLFLFVCLFFSRYINRSIELKSLDFRLI